MLWKSDASCKCGVKTKSPQSRIARGDLAAEHEFPWQVAIFNFRSFICSGSLINNLYVLTAAHCFDKFRDENPFNNIRNIRVALGVHQRTEFSKFKEVRQINEVIIHENYVSNISTRYYDIALMKMKEPLTRYSSEISPICLPPTGPSYEGRTATVSGWGREHENGNNVNILRKANIKILSNIYCNQKLGTTFNQRIRLCADSSVGQTCPGDSGGPLMVHTGRQYLQVGIVSFGYGCKATSFPDVYTRVNVFVPWIQTHTRDAKYCEY
ncbi:Serine proteinase stubble [Armadillidium vulgare]|nr:Serine proteinase stubble [Armadillidium vulgare]